MEMRGVRRGSLSTSSGGWCGNPEDAGVWEKGGEKLEGVYRRSVDRRRAGLRLSEDLRKSGRRCVGRSSGLLVELAGGDRGVLRLGAGE